MLQTLRSFLVSLKQGAMCVLAIQQEEGELDIQMAVLSHVLLVLFIYFFFLSFFFLSTGAVSADRQRRDLEEEGWGRSASY